MLTDRELLELAAKAARLTVTDQSTRVVTSFWGSWGGSWNPLDNDGDALRLAVKLRMMIDDIRQGYKEGHIVAVADGAHAYEPRGDDPYAATRRAIVRAAAELGKEKP